MDNDKNIFFKHFVLNDFKLYKKNKNKNKNLEICAL